MNTLYHIQSSENEIKKKLFPIFSFFFFVIFWHFDFVSCWVVGWTGPSETFRGLGKSKVLTGKEEIGREEGRERGREDLFEGDLSEERELSGGGERGARGGRG